MDAIAQAGKRFLKQPLLHVGHPVLRRCAWQCGSRRLNTFEARRKYPLGHPVGFNTSGALACSCSAASRAPQQFLTAWILHGDTRVNWLGMLSLIVAGLVSQSVGHSDSLKKVWDLDLKKIIGARGLKYTHDLPVVGLRFSPDGASLAAVVDLQAENVNGVRQGYKSYLIAIRAYQPESVAGVFEVDGGLAVGENGAGPDNFGWSPSGKMIYAGGIVFDFEQGKRCEMPGNNFFGALFLGDDLAMEKERPDFGPSGDWYKVSHFTFLDADCQPQGKWEVSEQWTIQDVSLDRGLLSVSRTIRDLPIEELRKGALWFKTENLIVDPIARKVLHRWAGTQAPGGHFVDSGKAICAGSDAAAADRAPVTCWEVDTGKKIGEAPTANGGDPIVTALHGPRIVASDYRRRKIPFSSEYKEVFNHRVVWDFRSGKELVSWRPEFQSWEFQIEVDPSKPLKHVREPYRLAISPDGQYIVEGGNGVLHLYRIVP
jgi:hypothetical protein